MSGLRIRSAASRRAWSTRKTQKALRELALQHPGGGPDDPSRGTVAGTFGLADVRARTEAAIARNRARLQSDAP